MTLLKDAPVMSQHETTHTFFEILNSNKDLCFIINLATFTFEYISQRSVDFFGFTPEQIQSFDVHKFFELIHPDDIENLNAKVLKKPDCHTLEEINYRFKYEGLRYKWLTEKRQILYSQYSEPTYMISSCKEM